MLGNYVAYLEFLDKKLTKFFKSQKPFIFCKKGCAKCCKNAEFPYSALEARYLIDGALSLSEPVQKRIEENLQKTIALKKKFKGKKFLYNCPFLIDDVCCVYDYRGIICRSFGLMTNQGDGKVKAPFCAYEGQNYSNVLNLKKNTISQRKYKRLGVKEEPLGFNISYKYLTDKEFEETFHLSFGEKKPLIEWFM